MPFGKLMSWRIHVKIRLSFAPFQVLPLTEATWGLKTGSSLHVLGELLKFNAGRSTCIHNRIPRLYYFVNFVMKNGMRLGYGVYQNKRVKSTKEAFEDWTQCIFHEHMKYLIHYWPNILWWRCPYFSLLRKSQLIRSIQSKKQRNS